MRSSWKAAHTSRRAATIALIALALCAWCSGARADSGPAQEVGDTLSASRVWISKVRWEGIELLDRDSEDLIDPFGSNEACYTRCASRIYSNLLEILETI